MAIPAETMNRPPADDGIVLTPHWMRDAVADQLFENRLGRIVHRPTAFNSNSRGRPIL